MKKYLFVVVSAVFLSCNNSTIIKSSLNVRFQPRHFQIMSKNSFDVTTITLPFGLEIEQTICMQNYNEDTLYLYMGLSSSHSFVHGLKEWTQLDHSQPYDEDIAEFAQTFKLSVDQIDYSQNCLYENNTLKVVIPRKAKHIIEVHYQLFNVSYNLLFTPTPTSIYTQDVYYYDLSDNYSQWYFSTDNMTWSEVKIHSPNDSIAIFANYPLIRKENDYIFDFKHAKEEEGLWFTVFDKSLYSKNSYKIRNTTFNMYSQKYFDVDSSNTIVNMHTPPDSVIIKDLTTTEAICSNVINFLDDTITRTVNIFKNVYGYARCSSLGGKNHNYLVLLDTARFDEDYYAQKWHHEFIHCFLSYPSDYDKKIGYLFVEGMTVYMDCCLYHRNEDSTEIGKHMARLYNKLSDEMKNTPLFYADRRMPYEVIYFKGAYCIYQFATRIGLEKFNSILKEYYALLNANGDYVTLESFEQCLKSHGVTDQDWNYFIELMS